jgi:hypothetical protein
MGLKLDFSQNSDGLVTGVRYVALKVGYGLPMHSHSSRYQYHNVECIEGEVFVFGYDWFKKLSPGEVFNDFDKGQPHAVGVLVPGAVWYNRLEIPQTPESLSVPEEYHRHTTVESYCDIPDWILKELEAQKSDLNQLPLF